MIRSIRKLAGNRFLVVLMTVLLFTLTFGAAVSAQGDGVPNNNMPQQGQNQNYSKANAFQDIMYLLQNYYVEDVEFNTLIQGAIEGMLNKVDRYSYYMDAEEYEEMQTEYEGHYGGIGIVITTRDNKLTIVSPIKNTPGERADLRAGDVITAINGEETAEMSQMKAVNMMRGEPGTEVIITITRGEEDPFDVKIIREDIEVPYVESEMKTEDIGYISLAQFIENVGTKVEEAVVDLKAQGAKGIVLDLRNNPGGLLDEAVNVASVFIDQGEVVSIRQRNQTERVLNINKQINSHPDIPLVVLINKGSASASEIVSGAVKDYERGKIVGVTSFGKGVVQSVIPLEDGSAVSLTTARYYTPDGNYIHEKGIEPDLKVERDMEAVDAAAAEGETPPDNQLDKALNELENMIFVQEFQDKKASGQ